MQKITTFLTFESRGQEAIDFYLSIFRNSKLNSKMVMPGTDKLLNASFSLEGQDYMAMDGDANFSFALGISLFVDCADQAEVDYYWERLSAEGGAPSNCGWLTDKFGVSWQIVPSILGELMSDPDPQKAQRVMQAMLQMTKIDIAELQRAHDAE